ncbi:MAG: hypothetical protein ACYTF1_11895 [Planctomycetota bacterium]|jgi:hypothetical protein
METKVNKTGLSHSDSAHENVVAPGAGEAVSVRPVQPADSDGLYQLWCSGRTHTPEDRQSWFDNWCWKYWKNPFRKDAPAGWVLVDGDRIIGHLGAVYVPFRIDDYRTTAVIPTDYVSLDDPHAEANLVEAFLTSVDECVTMACTNNDQLRTLFEQSGCQILNRTGEFQVALTDMKQQIRTFGGAGGWVIRQLFCGLGGKVLSSVWAGGYRLLGRRPAIRIPHGCRLETTTCRLACNWGSFHERIYQSRSPNNMQHPPRDTHVVGIDRTEAYMDWRYADNPRQENLHVLMVRDNQGDPIGALVIYIDGDHGPPIAYVQELMVIPSRDEVVNTLLCAALVLADEHGAGSLVTATGRPENRPILDKLGFQPPNGPGPAIFIQLQENPSDNPIGHMGAEYLDRHLELCHGEIF